MKIICGFNYRKAKLFWRRQRLLFIASMLAGILTGRILWKKTEVKDLFPYENQMANECYKLGGKSGMIFRGEEIAGEKQYEFRCRFGVKKAGRIVGK